MFRMELRSYREIRPWWSVPRSAHASTICRPHPQCVERQRVRCEPLVASFWDIIYIPADTRAMNTIVFPQMT